MKKIKNLNYFLHLMAIKIILIVIILIKNKNNYSNNNRYNQIKNQKLIYNN
jgi:hypothetical protein